MGDFYCKNCDKHQDFISLDVALEQFDHAIAIRKGRMCPNNNMEDFYWEGVNVAVIKFPSRYPTTATAKLVPRPDIVRGESIVSTSSPGNEPAMSAPKPQTEKTPKLKKTKPDIKT